jgi:hypothetical protein
MFRVFELDDGIEPMFKIAFDTLLDVLGIFGGNSLHSNSHHGGGGGGGGGGPHSGAPPSDIFSGGGVGGGGGIGGGWWWCSSDCWFALWRTRRA